MHLLLSRSVLTHQSCNLILYSSRSNSAIKSLTVHQLDKNASKWNTCHNFAHLISSMTLAVRVMFETEISLPVIFHHKQLYSLKRILQMTHCNKLDKCSGHCSFSLVIFSSHTFTKMAPSPNPSSDKNGEEESTVLEAFWKASLFLGTEHNPIRVYITTATLHCERYLDLGVTLSTLQWLVSGS